MSLKNYSKYSNKFKKQEDEVINNEVVETSVETPVEEVTPVVNDYVKTGTVVGCEKLNLRENPSKDAKVLVILNKGEKVQVDMSANSTPDFYRVCTAAGVKGYCMTKFISVE